MNIFLFSSLITLIGYLILIFYISFKNNRNIQSIAFTCFVTSLALWIMSDIYYYTPLAEHFSHNFWNKLFFMGGFFAPAFYYHFFSIFIKVKTRISKWIISFWYCLGAVLTVANFTSPYFFKEITFNPLIPSVDVSFGPLFYLYLTFNLLGLIHLHYLMIKTYLKSKGSLHEKFKYFALASLVLVTAALLTFSIYLKIHNLRVENFLMLLYTIIIAYAITKHDVLDIKVVISRFGSYFIVFSALIMSMLLAHLYLPLPLFFESIFAILWLFYGEKIRQKIQTSAEIKWISDWYDPQEVIKSITKDLSNIFDRKKTIRACVEILNKIMDFKQYYLLIAEYNNHNGNDLKYLFEDNKDLKIKLDHNHDFISFLSDQNTIISSNNVPQQILSSIKNYQAKDSIIIPLHSLHRFEGAIILGKRLSEISYSSKDLDLFNTIRDLLKVFFERLNPYDEVLQEYHNSLVMAGLARKNETYAKLVTGITHEIHNPLTSVKMCLDFIKQSPGSIEVNTYLEKAHKNLKRVVDITNLMLKYGNPIEENKKIIQIKQIINDVDTIMELELKKKHITIRKEIEDKGWINASAKEIYLVLVNLLLNASNAIGNSGIISISTKPASFINNDSQLVKGVKLIISDNGKGIPKQALNMIFDPFYSTVHTNVGLGLSIVMKIIKDHGGRIDIDSKEGQGTSVTILMPEAEHERAFTTESLKCSK
ncbi:ATP-binding protein [Candidatus Margulisiibacteriota bacterium]